MTFMLLGRKFRLTTALLTVLALVLAGGSSLSAPINHQANGLIQMQTTAPSGVVVVKMATGSADHKIVSPERLAQAVKHLLPNALVQSRFTGLSKNMQDSELSRYFELEAHGLDRSQLLKLVGTLNSDPAVEVAFLEPVAVPAAQGFDAFTGAVPEISQSGGSPEDFEFAASTPDFESYQDYLDDAPLGIGALSMRTQGGSTGAGITVIDVEGGWLWSHEDLPAPVAELGVQINDLGWRNHGTAVLSEIRGHDNGFGVTGIAPDCSVGCSSIGAISTAGALAAAVDVLQRGDLILIELHAPGPNADGNGQFGYVPMEYWPDNFDIIRLATAKGIIVCEAAGNGYQNLDGPEYLGLFDRTVRDSGAIMCGATAGGQLYSADFSNNGSRVDLNGWGYYVTAAGYGDLQTGDETEWYTSAFSGTSSASPIVTGAVTSLQGMVMADWGVIMDARLARDILRETGTAMVSGNAIGTRPNLVEAFAHADTIIGLVQGTVTDEITGLPVADVMVQVANHGSFTLSDDTGHWQLPLVEGLVTLEFISYFYHDETVIPSILGGTATLQDVVLTPLEKINITGQIRGPEGPVSGVLVTPVDQPVTGDTSDATGVFSINVPALYDFTLLFDGASGFGARIEVVSTAGRTSDVVVNPLLPVVSENFGFDDGGFVADVGLWTHDSPPNNVTGGAFESSDCWGIGMDGDYGDDEYDTLLSPVYNLSGVTGEDYFLSFHYFSSTEPGFDGVNLEVSGNDGFVLLMPLEGYTDPALGGLGGDAGWSGDSGRWHGTVFDISEYADADFQFRLNFGSDAGVFEQGFYIDGIAFGSGDLYYAVAVENTPAPTITRLKAWPNPFNPRVNLEYSLTQPGHLQVEVFDLRGNRVRTLFNAPVLETRGTLSWDGCGDNGRSASSGVYLVRVKGPDSQVSSQRVVLAK
ncbi:MAG: S8 family serine peptidase [Gemmatimonadales bacterium]|nr:S8 family serine peptidase [Gemmatimonadales bacterium]